MATQDLPFIKKELKVIVHNPNNLPVIDYHKLSVLQGDLKTLSETNKAKLCKSILEHGYFIPAFVWRSDSTMYILDATQRYHALEALEKGIELDFDGHKEVIIRKIPDIPYIEIEAKDKKDAAQKLLQITSRYGTINEKTRFFEDFDIELDYINEIEIPELDIMLDSLDSTDIVEDEVPEVPVESVTQVGDLWSCGKHRVLCGDATKAEDVERLMQDKKVDCVLTDPPYGINQKGIPNDTPEESAELIKNSIALLPVSNAVIVAFQSTHTFPIWLDAIRAAGYSFERILSLYKEAQCTFPWRGWILTTESILVSSLGKPKWQDVKPYVHDTYKLPEISGELDSELGWHGAVKPLVVVKDILSRISPENGNVYDPFLGSGTTLIAADSLNRICYGMEIEPHYVDVILERYATFTSNDPVREDGKKWSELKSI